MIYRFSRKNLYVASIISCSAIVFCLRLYVRSTETTRKINYIANDSSTTKQPFKFNAYITQLEDDVWLDKLPQYLEEEQSIKLANTYSQDFTGLAKELIDARIRQQKASKLADEIKRKYLTAKRNRILTAIGNSYVTATCRFPNTTCYDEFFVAYRQLRVKGEINECRIATLSCNGLGDRLRGSVIALYLAIATGRIFHFDWLETSNIADYFLVNQYFYQVSKDQFENTFAEDVNEHSSIWLLHRYDVPHTTFTDDLAREAFLETYKSYSNLLLMTNRFEGLDSIAKNPAFKPKLSSTLPSLYNGEETVKDFSIAISAALQVFFSQPNDRLLTLLNEAVESEVGLDLWKTSYKIGVQLRSLILDGHYGTGTTLDHLHCFVDDIENRVKTLMEKEPWFSKLSGKNKVVIFVTGDWQDGINYFLTNSRLIQNPRIAKTFTVKFSKVSHIDMIKKYDWIQGARTFGDWYMLTRMDYIVASPSSFSSLAAHLSLRPLKRFEVKPHGCEFHDMNKPMPFVQQTSTVPLADVL